MISVENLKEPLPDLFWPSVTQTRFRNGLQVGFRAGFSRVRWRVFCSPGEVPPAHGADGPFTLE